MSGRSPSDSARATWSAATFASPAPRCASTAQLIDAHSGAQLWSETYDRTLERQRSVRDPGRRDGSHRGDGRRTRAGCWRGRWSASVRADVPLERASVAQLLLRCWGLQHESAAGASMPSCATASSAGSSVDPNNADLWAELANLYLVEHSLCVQPAARSAGPGLRAARRAIENRSAATRAGWRWLAMAHAFTCTTRRGLFEEAVGAGRSQSIRATPQPSGWMGNILHARR